MGTKKEKTRGRGRPPVNPPEFTERFMIRTTPADLEEWKVQAAGCGLSVAPWLRMVANKEVARLKRAA